jgi:LuxR family maltose regulon positive regulatory protein
MFESKADIQSAIRHAVEGGDQGRVGFLVVKHGMAHATRGEFEALRSWLPLLRGARAGGGPEVTLALANALIVLGQVTEALDLLADIDELDQPSMAYAALQLRALSMLKDGQLDTLRTIANELRAKLSGETPAFGSDALPFEAHGYSGLISGIAALVEGELGTARASLEPALDRHDSNLLSEEVPAWLARTAVAEGKLDLASRHAQESIDRHENRGGGETVVVVPAYVAQADVAWERNELESAERLLEMARRHVRPVWWEMVFVQLSASRLLASRGAVDEAREQLIACGRTYLTGESSTVLRSMLCEALIDLALRTDDLNDAQRWVAVRSVWDSRQLGLPLRLRLAVARGEKTQFEHLDELVATEPLPHAIDAHLAGATLAARSGDHRQCQYFLAGAVRRAERERMIRRIIDYSGEVRVAIRELGEDPPIDPAIPLASPFFVASIVTALDADVGRRPRPATQSDELVEQLTGRELEVLECLSTSRTYREIGSRLYISRNTIKSHVRHIYTKLGVINRDAAVQEGRRLGLL